MFRLQVSIQAVSARNGDPFWSTASRSVSGKQARQRPRSLLSRFVTNSVFVAPQRSFTGKALLHLSVEEQMEAARSHRTALELRLPRRAPAKVEPSKTSEANAPAVTPTLRVKATAQGTKTVLLAKFYLRPRGVRFLRLRFCLHLSRSVSWKSFQVPVRRRTFHDHFDRTRTREATLTPGCSTERSE